MIISMKKLTDQQVAEIVEKLKDRKPDKEFMGHPLRKPPVPHPVKIYYIDDLQVWDISGLTYMFLPKDMTAEQVLDAVSGVKMPTADDRPEAIAREPEAADPSILKEM